MDLCKLEVVLLLCVTPSDNMKEVEDAISEKVEELTELDCVTKVYINDMEYLDE